MILSHVRAFIFALLLLSPLPVLGQNAVSPPVPSGSNDELLKSQELDALVAPIALYPDPLLSLVLMASTYPLEVVQADRWVKENKHLKGDQLKAAADKKPWDESVKSLIATSDVLSMMSAKLDWTQKLGDAVLAQQPDVMDAIQRLRLKTESNDKLESTKQQKITKTQVHDKQVIAIEPTDPNTIYVPYYDPAVVYGDWPYSDYPPYYFPAPDYIGTGILGTGIAFGAGYALGRWVSGGNYWGGGFNWNRNNINVNRPISGNTIANNWQHSPQHRQGVRYNNANVQQKFGNNTLRNGSQSRNEFRGRSGEQGQRPGGDRGAGERAQARPSTGDRNKAQQAQRKPSQQRSSAQRSTTAKKSTPAKRSTTAQRPTSGASRSRNANAFGNVQSGRTANLQSQRGRASFSGGGGAARARAGGGGGRGGGRRSDIAFKHDIVLLGHLANGIGFYRFSYNGSERAYVGVLAQDVEKFVPQAVTRGADGYLRVFYEKLGLKFQTFKQWIESGAAIPSGIPRPN